jgi:hypothetical protein
MNALINSTLLLDLVSPSASKKQKNRCCHVARPLFHFITSLHQMRACGDMLEKMDFEVTEELGLRSCLVPFHSFAGSKFSGKWSGMHKSHELNFPYRHLWVQVFRARVKTFRADIDAAKRQITKVKSFGSPTSARDELFSKGEEVISPFAPLNSIANM